MSTMPPISTIRTITSHLNSLDIEKGGGGGGGGGEGRQMTLEIQILARQRHKKWGGVKQVNGIPTLSRS